MSLVTAVIMLFIYIATQISLLRTVINILKEEYGCYTSQYCGI